MSFQLSEFQIKANEAIDNGHHVLITAHTGSGKTLPAEYAIKYFTEKGKKVIYTSPIKALSNQKYSEFIKKFPNLSIGIMTGDNKHNPDADVIIMTTEILQNNLFKTNQNAYLKIEMDIENELGCVIFDEIHYIDDADRGTVWEQSIILLPDHIQMVMLSATIGEKERFAGWIESIKNKKVVICSTDKRVVPLNFYTYFTVPSKLINTIQPPYKKVFEDKNNILDPIIKNIDEVIEKNKKCLQYLKTNDIEVSRKFVINELCLQLRDKEMFPALFFIFSRKQVQEYANDLQVPLFCKDEKDYMAEPVCRQLLVSRVSNWKEYICLPEYQYYINLLEKGIGIHHAGMLPIFREMMEILYDKKFIKVLFATETFAIGLNMPTKTVCFTSLFKHDGNSLRQLHSHEFIQMAGRAGRRNIDIVGNVILLTNLYKSLDTGEYFKLLNSPPKIIKSKFKINYSLILHYLNHYSIDECILNIKKSMMYQDIINEIKYSNNKIVEHKKEIEIQQKFLKNEQACRVYIDFKNDLCNAKNKMRREILNNIYCIESEVRDIEQQVNNYNRIQELITLIKNEENAIIYAENYITLQVNYIYNILQNNGYIENNILSKRGNDACYIREIHPLIFCDLYNNYNGFEDYSYIDIFCILTCLYDIKITDDYTEFTPTFLIEELKFINERLYYYYDEEVKYQLVYNEQVLQYDLMRYIKIWMEECNTENGSIQLIDKLKKEKGIFTGDFIKCCLKLVNISKEIECMCSNSLKEKLIEGKNKLLKFICSNESLYIN
jgi:superfamily II RNA helicase